MVRIGILALLAGCIVGEDGAPAGDGSPPGGNGGGSGSGGNDSIPTNGLVLDVVLASQLQPVVLGAAPIAADGSLAANPGVTPGFADTDGGRALLKYIAICALPPDHALVVGADRYPGYYGLAPAWETAACDDDCQHWVSACMLAHANANGTHVPISLRGDHAGLPATVRDGFTIQESAFYGNLFARELYACMGVDATTDTYERAILGRICGLGQCGLVDAGWCTLTSNAMNFGACDHDTGLGGFYADCRSAPDASLPTMHAVVTVYLEP